MESHLQSLLQAVEGLSSSINRVNRAAGERPPQAEGSEEEGEEELGGTSSQGEPSEPLGLPEPNPSHIAHLLEMGFSLETVRKALLLTNNRLEQATEWLLEHAGDPDAEVPLTEAQLQQLASRRPRPRQRPRLVTELQRPHGGRADIAASPELVDLLVEMGFERPRAAAALQAFGNNMDLACHWLLNSTLQSMARGPGANSAAPAPTAGRWGAPGNPSPLPDLLQMSLIGLP